ncbi:MAG: hypothetical protein ACXVJD_08770 [Mucilaginibacter sp.]
MFKYLAFFLLLGVRTSIAQKVNQSIIYEGVGVGGLKLGKLTGAGIKQKFGPAYVEINYPNYSVEISYKSRGLSFYHRPGADTAKIFAIDIYPAFKGKTSRGFDMRTMNVRDMLRIYGMPLWDLESGDKVIYARFMGSGIYFGFKLKQDLPEEFKLHTVNLSDKMDKYFATVYGLDRVTEITIGKPETEF